MGRALRILLVEDDPGDVFLVKEALNRHSLKHELTVAGDGGAAWALIERADTPRGRNFDIFLLDLNLPVRPGLELLKRIRSSRRSMARALVVIVTSSNSPVDRDGATQGGADYYFCKPSHFEEFLQLGSVLKELCAARARKKTTRTGLKKLHSKEGA
jgi:DNA-binding response OmpR family regulator